MKVSHWGLWLDVDLTEEHRVLSWATLGGGLVPARRVSWRQVDDQDLPLGVDPVRWIHEQAQKRKTRSDVVLLTSRRISNWEQSEVTLAGASANTIATVGLSNGVRVGHSKTNPQVRQAKLKAWGTINILCRVEQPLSNSAMLEALSIAAEARTLALLDRQITIAGERITGTGTDCIAIAAPSAKASQELYAGKHTAIGRAVGQSVLQAVGRGADAWLEERRQRLTQVPSL